MPLYELFCLARPRLGKSQLADIIKLAGRTVLDKGGVITDVKSFGEQRLAYEIRKPGERHSQVRIGIPSEKIGGISACSSPVARHACAAAAPPLEH